ncbi:MAG: hypothetical protein IJ371_02325 [Clostridia bacterium]|nr:hypothetical protein [Clostridia bacterium]
MGNRRIYRKGIVDNAKVASAQLLDDKNRHFHKLFVQKEAGNIKIQCKYNEYCDKYFNEQHQVCYTPVDITQAIQIEVFYGKELIKTYKIHTANRRGYIDGVTLTKGKITKAITLDSTEFEDLVHELFNARNDIDRFSISFINLAVSTIKTKQRIKQTPECVLQMSQQLEKAYIEIKSRYK